MTVTNDTYITAQGVCMPLEKIAALYIGIPSTIFLDKVRYQRCALGVKKSQEPEHGIVLPALYSPNLNLEYGRL